eukprot:CAMPEP_0172515266 /NCGR_PEP_ID=MMETSP1066-20121228/266724_1 /TAXON_ID=671091 /ORGANISM="Coscinodiscus wailesii, Strain CCMP2513" /LENGTH=50 /DNA_ID=CAMNT_0013296279 /DNA_START=125 /DNA_END=274 /DNA_ORIENTATION=-
MRKALGNMLYILPGGGNEVMGEILFAVPTYPLLRVASKKHTPAWRSEIIH